jgi:uncharacterized membrane protein YeiH
LRPPACWRPSASAWTVGVCIVTGLAAFGGGTLRDVLLDRRPFFWVAHPEWLWILIGLSAAAMLLLRPAAWP